MTTEELYDFMKRGFDQIQTQFETLNKRLENIETRLGSVENDVAWIKGNQLEGTQEGRAGVWQIVTTATVSVGAVIIALIALLK